MNETIVDEISERMIVIEREYEDHLSHAEEAHRTSMSAVDDHRTKSRNLAIQHKKRQIRALGLEIIRRKKK